MKISVVIVTYNRPQSLKCTLEALAGQSRHSDEIIIVDNGSDVDYTETISSFSHALRIVYTAIRKSSTAVGRNVGVSAAQGDIVVFTDDDCIPHERWLEHILLPFEKDKTIVGVGGKLSSYGDAGRPSINDFFDEEFRFYGERLRRFHCCRQKGELFPPYFITANAAFRKKALQEIGLFDELFGPAEDVDLSIRIYQKGWKVWYEERAVVFHKNRSTMGGFIKQYFYYGYYDVELYVKHRDVKRKLAIQFDRGSPDSHFGTPKKVCVIECPFLFPCYIQTVSIERRTVVLAAALLCLLFSADFFWGFIILFSMYMAMCFRFFKNDFLKESNIKKSFNYFLIRIIASKSAMAGQLYNSIKKGMIILVLYS